MKDLVIARYKEDISWIKKLDFAQLDLVIYNKGTDDLPFSSKKLPNIGGDAHTFIYYIVENYDNLPEFSIFIQGIPFDHCENVVQKINDHTTELFVWLCDHVVEESIHGWYEHLIQNNRPEVIGKPITYLDQTAREILGNETPERCTFGAGQQFIVSRDVIQHRDLDFYKRILDRFPNEVILPWHIERLWKYIFRV